MKITVPPTDTYKNTGKWILYYIHIYLFYIEQKHCTSVYLHSPFYRWCAKHRQRVETIRFEAVKSQLDFGRRKTRNVSWGAEIIKWREYIYGGSFNNIDWRPITKNIYVWFARCAALMQTQNTCEQIQYNKTSQAHIVNRMLKCSKVQPNAAYTTEPRGLLFHVYFLLYIYIYIYSTDWANHAISHSPTHTLAHHTWLVVVVAANVWWRSLFAARI